MCVEHYYCLIVIVFTSKSISSIKWMALYKVERTMWGSRCILIFRGLLSCHLAFPGGLSVKHPLASAGNTGSIPESGRSPGKGNGNLL